MQNFSCKIIFEQTTLSHIIVNIVHVFCAFNFRTSRAIQKYFVNAIYGSQEGLTVNNNVVI